MFKRNRPLKERLEEKTVKKGSCLIWTGAKDKGGYGIIWYKGGQKNVHRVAYEELKEPIPKGLHIRHSCDVRLCWNIDHLSVGTNADNVSDRVSRDRTPKGSQHVHSKLTEKQVKEIKKKHATGKYSQRALGREYGVSHTTIQDVLNNKQWKHVK